MCWLKIFFCSFVCLKHILSKIFFYLFYLLHTDTIQKSEKNLRDDLNISRDDFIKKLNGIALKKFKAA